jgi:hypothetical protein
MNCKHHIRLQAAFTIASAALLAPALPTMAAGSTIPVPANIGTMEGTAALIKAPPKLDAGGYALGMSADKALARMKADGMFNGGIGVKPSIGFTFRQLPDHPFIGGTVGARKLPSGGSESVGMLFTMYPNEPVVSGIGRTLSFGPENAPSVGNTLAELHKKYGPESASYVNTLFWVLDYQGHPLSKEQLAEAKKLGCLINTPGAGGGNNAGNIVDKDWMTGKIGRGYEQFMSGGRPFPDAKRPCFSTVHIDAYVTMSKASGRGQGWGEDVFISKAGDWERASSDLVKDLTVTIRDIPLDYSASIVSRNAVMNGGAAKEQKQRDAAGKRKPSL